MRVSAHLAQARSGAPQHRPRGRVGDSSTLVTPGQSGARHQVAEGLRSRGLCLGCCSCKSVAGDYLAKGLFSAGRFNKACNSLIVHFGSEEQGARSVEFFSE